jgi:hypothetical protein
VRSYNSFCTITLTNPVDANRNLVNNFTYQPSGLGGIVIVRVMHQWPVFVSLLGRNGFPTCRRTIAF